MPGLKSKNIAWFAELPKSNHITNLSTNMEHMSDLKQILKYISDYASKWESGDVFYNYRYREMLVIEKLIFITGKHHTVSYIKNKRQYDCMCDDLIYEIKTGNSKSILNTVYQLDKQNDSLKVKEMKQIDGYIFANFHEYSLRLLIRVTTESGLRKIKTIIREKQKNRAIKEKNRKLEGKRTRDNIDITGREILENLNDEDMLIIDQYDNTILKSTLLNKE